jgi:hypothetical protein
MCGRAHGPYCPNYLHFGVRASSGWRCYEQDKHHRWSVNEAQIRQYHLSRSLTRKSSGGRRFTWASAGCT